MALLDDLEHDISDVLSASWDLRDGEVVPSTENVALSGGGVKIAATMLYADLAESIRDGGRRVRGCLDPRSPVGRTRRGRRPGGACL